MFAPRTPGIKKETINLKDIQLIGYDTSYDRYEMTAKHQIYPDFGDKPISNINGADIK